MSITTIIINALEQADRSLFRLINQRCSQAWLDQLLPLWRTPEFWTPLYLFLLVFMLYNFGKKAGWWLLYFIITVSLMDWTGNTLIKQTVQRLRPCNDPLLSEEVLLRIPHCGSGYSFISNHAANHFAMATFAFLTVGALVGKWRWLFFAWAFSIAFAQVYVGVHYPLDVLAGAGMGVGAGSITAGLFNKRHRFTIFDAATTSSL